MSIKTHEKSKVDSYATGIGSVLDLSGDPSAFEHFCQRQKKSQSDWEAIGGDLRRVGEHLQKAIIDYFEALPKQKQAEILRSLLAAVKEERISPENKFSEVFSSESDPLTLVRSIYFDSEKVEHERRESSG